jgi:hypothetical protein
VKREASRLHPISFPVFEKHKSIFRVIVLSPYLGIPTMDREADCRVVVAAAAVTSEFIRSCPNARPLRTTMCMSSPSVDEPISVIRNNIVTLFLDRKVPGDAEELGKAGIKVAIRLRCHRTSKFALVFVCTCNLALLEVAPFFL